MAACLNCGKIFDSFVDESCKLNRSGVRHAAVA